MRKFGPLATAFCVLMTWAVPCFADRPAVPANPTEQSDPRVAATIERLEQLVTEQPENPESWYTLAAFYAEESKRSDLSADLSKRYVMRASEANDWALMINPV